MVFFPSTFKTNQKGAWFRGKRSIQEHRKLNRGSYQATGPFSLERRTNQAMSRKLELKKNIPQAVP